MKIRDAAIERQPGRRDDDGKKKTRYSWESCFVGPRVSGDISLRMMRSLGAEESSGAQQI